MKTMVYQQVIALYPNAHAASPDGTATSAAAGDAQDQSRAKEKTAALRLACHLTK